MTARDGHHVFTVSVWAFSIVIAGLLVTSCAKSEEAAPGQERSEGAQQAQGEEESHEPAFLFVQSSRGFTYDGTRLTLLGTSPTTTYFSDRPDRIAGHISVEEAYRWGNTGDDTFAENPANATLSNLREGEIGNVVLTLRDIVLDLERDRLSWEVDILEGELPAEGGPNTLFIDVIGRPLTPVSVAGVNRRTRRRSMAVGMAVGAAANEGRYDDSDEYYYEPSLEEELADLRDMLDQGLITRDEYDSEKAELLAAY